MERGEKHVIKYEITGREDGRWSIEAFDFKGDRLGTKVLVMTEDEAIKVFMMLNGRALNEDPEVIRQHLEYLKRAENEKTQEIILDQIFERVS